MYFVCNGSLMCGNKMEILRVTLPIILSYVLASAFFYIFIAYIIWQEYSPIYIILDVIFFVFGITFFCLSSFTDPGFIP